MRLATLRAGGRDGTLAVVASDGTTATVAPGGLRTLQAALDDWSSAEPLLRAAYERCEPGAPATAQLDVSALHSPLPRTYQWCDASTYLTHMERIRASRGMALPPAYDVEPIVYQCGSDVLLAPTDPVALGDESPGLDLELEVAAVTDDVRRTRPTGRRGRSSAHIRHPNGHEGRCPLSTVSGNAWVSGRLAEEQRLSIGYASARREGVMWEQAPNRAVQFRNVGLDAVSDPPPEGAGK